MYDGAQINAHWDNAWPTEIDVTNHDHEFSPVLQAPVANLLGKPWYLAAGSPGGDYVTWLDLPNGNQVGVSPHPHHADDLMRWVIAVNDDSGCPVGDQDDELLITATPEEVAARVGKFLAANNIEVPAAGLTPEGVAERFGMPIGWARSHRGRHICLDGRNYIATCIVTDPAMEQVARSFMGRQYA